jgi:hypothetical protein
LNTSLKNFTRGIQKCCNLNTATTVYINQNPIRITIKLTTSKVWQTITNKKQASPLSYFLLAGDGYIGLPNLLFRALPYYVVEIKDKVMLACMPLFFKFLF